MARGGRKYPLLVYQHLLNRWWPAMFTMGLAWLAWAYSEYIDPLAPFIQWRWQLCVGVGVLAFLVGLLFIVLKQIAYVQPFPTYLKLVTPFLHMNISYKRIRKTTTTEMRLLFPPKGFSGWVQDIFAPLATRTAVILELTSYPISRNVLRLFLYRFFFKDATPHLVILVQDWMRFSAEIESMRTGIDLNPPNKPKRSSSSILSRLPHQ
jgi:hypothetical protein